jgi:hypothetical protein
MLRCALIKSLWIVFAFNPQWNEDRLIDNKHWVWQLSKQEFLNWKLSVFEKYILSKMMIFYWFDLFRETFHDWIYTRKKTYSIIYGYLVSGKQLHTWSAPSVLELDFCRKMIPL